MSCNFFGGGLQTARCTGTNVPVPVPNAGRYVDDGVISRSDWLRVCFPREGSPTLQEREKRVNAGEYSTVGSRKNRNAARAGARWTVPVVF